VRIVSQRRLQEFAQRFPRAQAPLTSWADVVEHSAWKNPADLRRTFGSADFVGELTVFNIGGNNYRLIAYVHYRRQIVFIKNILTHDEYDKGKWK
jgi:mRNA interferase HigB